MLDDRVIFFDNEENFTIDDNSDFENIAPVSTKRVDRVTNPRKTIFRKKEKSPMTSMNIETGSIGILTERDMNEDEDNVMYIHPVPKQKKFGNGKTVEEMYQKKTQLEHILLRPDTYIGSVERISQDMYVFDSDTNRIVQREVQYTPGLFKIFDEILVNAADNKQRDENMDKLDIVINTTENLISVKNNGQGIPIVMHKEHNCYVPTLIFGHLLTGSNFDDDEKKTTGGRNGYGAKLANIFSKKFIVECFDSEKGLKFVQKFYENMKISESPLVRKCSVSEKKKGDYVKISFSPDFVRFKMSSLDKDSVALLSKRAYDIAGSMASRPGKKLVVTLNDKKLSIKNFQEYLKLYKELSYPTAYECVGNRWEVGVGVSDGTFEQISFVNAINTSKGGQHVNYIADQVTKRLVSAVNKKNKGGVKITENQMKNHICIFINCLIENPVFDSQTKENMTTRKNAFGSICMLSEKFMKQVEKSSVVDKILAFAKFKQTQALQKQGGVKKMKLFGIAKLDDANYAGSTKSVDCTLILTEGDSAKSLAMSGLSIVGRDYYGVFPLKGKPLNVREASHKQIMGNEEIKNVVDIMGLKFGMRYYQNNMKSLRYGKLMIMADQDHDGSHIKGLIINFIHHFWPTLLHIPGFLQQFITPIVKTYKGNKTHTFFTLPEYENWRESIGNNATGWTVKYYKGLGTSTSAEAKEYFSSLDLHEIHFSDITHDECSVVMADDDMHTNNCEMYEWNQKESEIIKSFRKIQASGSSLIEMAFSRRKVEERKLWLNNLEKGTFLNYSEGQTNGVKYSDFINKELILFSQADNQRSIPNLYDGFKPSQRKVLFACFLKNLRSEMKVAQLSGYVGEKSAYHHGEASLAGTIINMAQDFVGSNNINLLTPAGQFGTRRMGGKDAASPRYIFTKLEKVTRTIFHPDDDALLTYLQDDGETIEPEYYMPVIPMILVNGSEGIGTGWSTNIPNFDPREIIYNIRMLIKGESMKSMLPYYYGFTGNIDAEPNKIGTFSVKGKIERKSDTSLVISELPLRRWTQDYKVFLEGMMSSDKVDSIIKDLKENHTDSTVSFTITAEKVKIDEFERGKDGLYGKFKLSTTVTITNMNLFDENGRIVKFMSPEEIMSMFYEKRLNFYFKRKEYLLKMMKREQQILNNKARFVEEVCAGNLIVSNRKRKELLTELKEKEYDQFPKDQKKNNNSDINSEDSEAEEFNDDSGSDLAKGYNYLLGMMIWSLTYEKGERLRQELADKTQDVINLEATAPTQIWEKDLESIEEALNERDDKYKAAAVEEFKARKKSQLARGKVRNKTLKIKSGDSDEVFFVTEKKPVNRKKTKKQIKNDTQAQLSKTEVLAKTLEMKLKVSDPLIEISKRSNQSTDTKIKSDELKSVDKNTDDIAVANSVRNSSSRSARSRKQVCYTLDESSVSDSSDFIYE